MSFFKIINPPELGRPRGYSNGLLAPPGGRILFIAGQVGWDKSQQLVGEAFHEQFAQALANVLTVVREAGGGAEHVGRLTLYVVDRSEYEAQLAEVGAAYRRLMGSHYPTMALIEVAGLLEEGASVEIEGTAVLPSEG